jgi:D-amino-acid oxidase
MADADSWMHELHRVDPWFKDLVPDFRVLPAEGLPPGIDSATAFTSVCINTAVYLSYLLSQCIKNGVVVRRGVLKHVSDAAKLHHSREEVDLIVNCTGLLSSKLGGVMDKDVIPARGQTVLVRNNPGIAYTVSGTDDGQDEMCYVIPREAGGGTILGGTYEEGSWESQPCPNTAMRIMKRAVDICPQLTGGRGIEALDIIRHGVGLRPLRLSGVRIEREQIAGTWVVHNYGHGGWGYQGSYGCAQRAVELVDEALGPRR